MLIQIAENTPTLLNAGLLKQSKSNWYKSIPVWTRKAKLNRPSILKKKTHKSRRSAKYKILFHKKERTTKHAKTTAMIGDPKRRLRLKTWSGLYYFPRFLWSWLPSLRNWVVETLFRSALTKAANVGNIFLCVRQERGFLRCLLSR